MRWDNKIISGIAPKWALKREESLKKLEIFSLGYSRHGASTTKKSLLGWLFKSGAPDDDIVRNIENLRSRSRDLYMGVPLAAGALKTIRTNIVGAGLQLKAQVDAEFLGLSEDDEKTLEKEIEREFALWADTQECDAERRNNFGQLQALAFLSQLMSGDVFTLLPVVPRPGMPYDLRVRLIEADRICNPHNKIWPNDEVLGGVEIGKYGEPVAYHIAQRHPAATRTTINTWLRVPAFGAQSGRRNVLHLMEQERPEQRRGVPILAPVIEALKQLGRYTDAELVAAVVSGLFTVFVTTEGDMPMGSNVDDSEKIAADDAQVVELGNGAIVGLNPGEKVQESNPGRPNTAFDGFVTAICRQIGAAIELPYELLIKHFTASYSASRAALLEAWKMFRMRRTWLAIAFNTPIYEEWFTEAVAKGRINAPGYFKDPAIKKAYLGAEWYGPSQGQIDPLKEANAAKVRIQECLSTRAREAAEIGGSNFDVIIKDRIREEKQMREGELIYVNDQPLAKEGEDEGEPTE